MLVSFIMPTAHRRPLIPRSTEYFEDYQAVQRVGSMILLERAAGDPERLEAWTGEARAAV